MEKRTIEAKSRATPTEREVPKQKMAECETRQLCVYLRRIALGGKVLQFDVSGIHAPVPLMRYAVNNLFQNGRDRVGIIDKGHR